MLHKIIKFEKIKKKIMKFIILDSLMFEYNFVYINLFLIKSKNKV